MSSECSPDEGRHVPACGRCCHMSLRETLGDGRYLEVKAEFKERVERLKVQREAQYLASLSPAVQDMIREMKFSSSGVYPL